MQSQNKWTLCWHICVLINILLEIMSYNNFYVSFYEYLHAQKSSVHLEHSMFGGPCLIYVAEHVSPHSCSQMQLSYSVHRGLLYCFSEVLCWCHCWSSTSVELPYFCWTSHPMLWALIVPGLYCGLGVVGVGKTGRGTWDGLFGREKVTLIFLCHSLLKVTSRSMPISKWVIEFSEKQFLLFNMPFAVGLRYY